MSVRALIIFQFMLLSFCLGCAGTKSFPAGDLLVPESPGPLPAAGPFVYNGYDDFGEDDGYGGAGAVAQQTMLMAGLGIRRVEKDDWYEDEWDELGVMGVHIISDSGIGINWALLSLRSDWDGLVVDPTDGSVDPGEEKVDALELQFGVRYQLYVTDWFWPFARAGARVQLTRLEMVDPLILGPLSYKGEALGFGVGLGLGMTFAFDWFRVEIGAGYSWMKFEFEYKAKLGPIDVSDLIPDKTYSVGAEPNGYLAIGGGF
ncbi:MAG: hypothetical protein E3J72_02295 [Planctomycetota bacterium]|nr:MAG: hypothetical protein E3J72_02295 [Planctomycetota bacterium]